ncbi:ImmA/IrrE family metallo-endopeptidase [Komagataeibacter sp. FNDCF1]|uniref:ImmA/IrrE family metallo-endopeptidase n=1 Tax=Komagataeibacter sp. FNDCF1 TaxID=2878681 RepID=UPI001E6101D3|nr:ImmA/IrrE family metallo-endopeptidase [Komagataeibacter sp. FNDCF1]MCE2564172.1 ImmA/IrrE family metallo-endopeptidase [Komagataeibacter sp. FNDCF1]
MTGDQAFDYVYPRPSGARKAAVEAFAETIAKDAGFEPGGDIFGFVAQMGGKILVGSSGYGDNESGSLIAKSFSDFTIYVSSLTSIERDRFTIAHELGHLFLHLPLVVTDDPDFLMRATRNIDESSESPIRKFFKLDNALLSVV